MLKVVSEFCADPGELLDFAHRQKPLVWLRGNRQAVGIGEALRLTASGPARFTVLREKWQEIAAAAAVTDEVHLPGSGLVAFGAFAFADDSAAQSSLVVPEITLHQHDNQWFVTRVTVASAHCATALPDFSARPTTPAGEWDPVALNPHPDLAARTSYLKKAHQVLETLAAGGAEKVVLARQISAPIHPNADLRVPLRRLAQRFPDCWTFAFDGFLGATPETLARVVRGRMSALVLAGTTPRAADSAADALRRHHLLASDSLAREHEYAAASVVEAVSDLVTKLQVTAPQVVQLPNVWHLATAISAHTTADVSALDLTAAMHPTAAVAGTPTSAAKNVIAAVEGFDRRFYAGAIGWLDASGDGEWALALRCAEVRDGVVTATAGGGFVAGSDPVRELDETVAKFAPIVDAFK